MFLENLGMVVKSSKRFRMFVSKREMNTKPAHLRQDRLVVAEI